MLGMGNYTSEAMDGLGAPLPSTSKPVALPRPRAAVSLPDYLYSIVANDIAVHGNASPFIGLYLAARASSGDSGAMNAVKAAIQRAWPQLENAFLRSRGLPATLVPSAY